MRKTWKTINDIIGRNKRSKLQTNFINDQGHRISDPEIVSNEFNDFFVNIGPKLASSIVTDGDQYYDYLKTPLSKNMFFNPIVEDEVIKIIQHYM